jgi:nucleotide-binding universal stress UspA family protein
MSSTARLREILARLDRNQLSSADNKQFSHAYLHQHAILKRLDDMMKDILTYIPTATRQPQLLEYAISLASNLNSHLQGMAFTFLPEFSGIYATMPGDFYTAILSRSEKETDDACRDFFELTGRTPIKCGLSRHTAMTSEAVQIFGRAARCFDLAIVPQNSFEDAPFFNPAFEDTIFLSGRPTVFVPSIHKGPAALKRILVCWDGNRCAARAAADALPLLALASNIDVLQIESGTAGAPESHATELGKHLDRHGIANKLHILRREDTDTGAAILSFAADCSSDLIVMGGYGHARTREMLFGGATREILHSMTVPVLMSH